MPRSVSPPRTWSWASTQPRRLQAETGRTRLQPRRQRLPGRVQALQGLGGPEKHVYDEDIIALVDDSTARANEAIQVLEVEVYCGSAGPQRAIITLSIDGAEHTAASRGNGPVDALFNAIRKLVPHDDATLALYQVHAVTQGTDAQAEVTVRLSENGRTAQATAADHDTLVASARAYVSALNKLILKRGRQPVDHSDGLVRSA
ncbi:alpha-isopropylmalate synthase regulatory domain-containing protein [Hankyongella ginsenosidimutans]|uniref:alpha-isopropylmalate synthase regulatory domain-containing protein n=1 Tax=Hankyongella ginsenosidimutans TaxID=1763828 RepID=UPI003CCC6960